MSKKKKMDSKQKKVKAETEAQRTQRLVEQKPRSQHSMIDQVRDGLRQVAVRINAGMVLTLLAKHGDGAKSIRALKPKYYRVVIQAAKLALSAFAPRITKHRSFGITSDHFNLESSPGRAPVNKLII